MEENMETRTVTPSARAVEADTLTEALRRTAASHPDGVALRTVNDAVSLTWSEVLERAEAIAGGLAGLGVRRGDAVALMLGNRVEFHLLDLAAALLGATPFSIYTTYPADEVRYLIEDAGARVTVVEAEFLEVVREARRQLPDLEHVITVDGEASEDTTALEQVEGSQPDFDVAEAAAAVMADDVLTLIYTSGTTGRPKGVELTHRNVMSGASAVEQIITFEPGARVISWLPAAHIAERMAHHYIPLIYAGTVTMCPNPREIVSFLPQVRPTWFFAVPRIWEKLKAGLETMQASQPEDQRHKAQAALSAAVERVRLRQRGEPVPDELEAAVARAEEEMFGPLRALLGLDQVRAVNVGAAPTPVEVLEFFHALGIEVAELWGMSETSGCGLCNRPGEVKLGTVGPPAPGTEVKLADDGELLIRGGFVMRGYRHQPERTSETLDSDGWLHTGDVAEIDQDGFVKIVDRKKELIINAAGKNMSPANIEATIKTSSPLIGQVCCIGDGRPYNTALIVLDADFAPVWAQQQGLEATEMAALAEDPRVRETVQAAIDEANRHLARVEQIKKFALLAEDWPAGGEELTPTMKLKRRPIAEKYAEEIETMYAG
jgi:long-subunit acyl-CoA synthetase (AMP-forming)